MTTRIAVALQRLDEDNLHMAARVLRQATDALGPDEYPLLHAELDYLTRWLSRHLTRIERTTS